MLVETKSGKHSILTNEYTIYQNSSSLKKKTITLKDISSGDSVVSLGDVDDKGNLTAKKIIKIDPVASPSAQFIAGQVSAVNGSSFTVKTAKNESVTVTTSGDTNIFLGSEEGSLSDIKSTRNIVAKGKYTEDQTTLSAIFVYIVPVYKNMKPESKKESTPSTGSTGKK